MASVTYGPLVRFLPSPGPAALDGVLMARCPPSPSPAAPDGVLMARPGMSSTEVSDIGSRSKSYSWRNLRH